MEKESKVLTGVNQKIANAEQEAKQQEMQKQILENMKKMQLYYLAIVRSGAAAKVKSIKRAMRRGKISPMGVIHRPFNNRKNTCKRAGRNSRFVTLQKKKTYDIIQRNLRKAA